MEEGEGLKIVFHGGRIPAWTLEDRGCGHIMDLYDEGIINIQSDGVFLEIPKAVTYRFDEYNEGDTEEWKRLGRVEFCPFCGEKIELVKE